MQNCRSRAPPRHFLFVFDAYSESLFSKKFFNKSGPSPRFKFWRHFRSNNLCCSIGIGRENLNQSNGALLESSSYKITILCYTYKAIKDVFINISPKVVKSLYFAEVDFKFLVMLVSKLITYLTYF